MCNKGNQVERDETRTTLNTTSTLLATIRPGHIHSSLLTMGPKDTCHNFMDPVNILGGIASRHNQNELGHALEKSSK